MANQVEQKYNIKQIIGSGMYGNVHYSINRQTGTEVAIKIVKLETMLQFPIYKKM